MRIIYVGYKKVLVYFVEEYEETYRTSFYRMSLYTNWKKNIIRSFSNY